MLKLVHDLSNAGVATAGWSALFGWAVVIILFGAIAGFIVGRRSAASGGTPRSGIYDGILRDILELRHVPGDSVAAALLLVKADMQAGRAFSDVRMRPVSRIECAFAKAAAHQYDLTILLYVHEERAGTVKVIKAKKSVDWAYLPSDVRATFIRDRKDRVTVLLYERKETGK